MRVLVISDVHANLTALEKVLKAAGTFDAAWCLGDLVGYGPDPNECIELIRTLPNILCVKGNHDDAVSKNGDVDYFNDEAGNSIMITRKLVTPENLQYLKELPEMIISETVTLAHGSLRHPIWEYILDVQTAYANFPCFTTPIAIVGHTHLPLVFAMDHQTEIIRRRTTPPDTSIQVDFKSIFNPGSVGQPRDYDSRASYAILDTDTMTWENQRVAYDIPAVQERILKLGIPEKLALRLGEGW